MVNGTKLLNACALPQKFTRGKRDGPLKNERVRHVVKIGSKNLQGIWCVPRALGASAPHAALSGSLSRRRATQRKSTA
jgi:hypothetical protein